MVIKFPEGRIRCQLIRVLVVVSASFLAYIYSPIWLIPLGPPGYTRQFADPRSPTIAFTIRLKRLPNFGLARNRRAMAVADFLLNLHTLGRLVLETTTLVLKSA